MAKNIGILLVILVIVGAGWWLYSNQQNSTNNENQIEESMEKDSTVEDDNSVVEDDDSMMDEEESINALPTEPGVVSGGITLQDGNNQLLNVQDDERVDLSMLDSEVKELSMTSYYSLVDEKPYPRYSTKEITVKKGDQVRLNVTVTAGNHDFNIDEYDISQTTPLEEEVTIEFTADKAGTFTYYCNMPGHRMNGHWGILNVIE